MKTILISIPKGRKWMHGFVMSLLGTLLFEQGKNNYCFSIATVDMPILDKPDKERYSRIAKAREKLIREAIDQRADYIWFLDDDMVFPVNSFRRLVSQDKDFITGVAFMKKPPYFPTILKAKTFKDSFDVIHEKYSPILDYPEETFEIDGVGLFGALIKVEAIQKLRRPWFSNPKLHTQSKIGEDVAFCRRIWEAGIKMYCDPNVKFGHMVDEDNVVTELEFKNGLNQLDQNKLNDYLNNFSL